MKFIERFFALKQIDPFSFLADSELALIANVAHDRSYQPHELVSTDDRLLNYLIITVGGDLIAHSTQQTLPKVIGLESLMFDLYLAETLIAGENGANCILINRSHFFTISYECPKLIVGLIDQHFHLEKPLYHAATHEVVE